MVKNQPEESPDDKFPNWFKSDSLEKEGSVSVFEKSGSGAQPYRYNYQKGALSQRSSHSVQKSRNEDKGRYSEKGEDEE